MVPNLPDLFPNVLIRLSVTPIRLKIIFGIIFAQTLVQRIYKQYILVSHAIPCSSGFSICCPWLTLFALVSKNHEGKRTGQNTLCVVKDIRQEDCAQIGVETLW